MQFPGRAMAASLSVLLAFATMGCVVTIKGGVHRFTAGEIEDARDKPALSVVEVESNLYSSRRGRAEVTLGVDIVNVENSTDFNDFRLTGRYIFREGKRVSPFTGGGIGWFRWFAKDVIPCPFPPPYTCAGGLVNDTIASGYFTHANGGVRVSVTDSVDWVLDSRYDFSKDDGSLDLDSYQVTSGVRLRW